jgi:hypothetical protein
VGEIRLNLGSSRNEELKITFGKLYMVLAHPSKTLKGIVSRDYAGLQMCSLDRQEVQGKVFLDSILF